MEPLGSVTQLYFTTGRVSVSSSYLLLLKIWDRELTNVRTLNGTRHNASVLCGLASFSFYYQARKMPQAPEDIDRNDAQGKIGAGKEMSPMSRSQG